MNISKIVFSCAWLPALTLSGWSQEANATDEPTGGVSGLQAASAAKFNLLYSFGLKAGDPIWPSAILLAQGRDGNIYTTSYRGGTLDSGTVFKIARTGALTVLSEFNGNNSGHPLGGLSLGTDGNFYGTTGPAASNQGTVFKITPKGSLTDLFDFVGDQNGGEPIPPPVQGVNGTFYGTTTQFGLNGSGTVYKITACGELTTIHQFDWPPGASPTAPLVQATDGNFYGTTNGGGTFNDGVVFRISPSGTYHVLYNFDRTHGASPYAGLIQGSDGNFYGTAEFGGSQDGGVIFKITSCGVFTVLHNFGTEVNDGINPAGHLVQASDGNFYGTTVFGGTDGVGTIYKLNPGGVYSIIHNFDDGSDPGALLQHTDGALYGTTLYGGAADGGTFYRLGVGAPAFVRFLPVSPLVGKTIEILGQGFTGTTGVSFGGVAGSFRVHSDTYLTATVPSGALTGRIMVKTPSAALNSNQVFRVHPFIQSFEPTSGPAGTEVVITGSGFTQTTAVRFGGIAATSSTLISDSQITAQVPSGAKIGPIEVTRIGGTGTTGSAVFTVTK